MRLLLLSFSLCLAAQGQGFDYQNLPFLGAGSPLSSLFPTNLYLSWKDKDIANPSVSIWTDEIQSNNAVQVTGGIQPLNTSTGLFFATSHLLNFTNTAVANCLAFCVYTLSDTIDGTHSSVIFDNTGASGNFSFTTSTGARNHWRRFLNGTGTFDVTGSIPTNTIVDFESGTNAAGNYIVFTNGIVDAQTPGNAAVAGLGVELRTMGGTGSFPFLIREFDIFTNIVLTTTISSNLNYYRKLVYGGQ